MGPGSIERMKLHPVDAQTQQRQHAEDVAAQFETVFVRTLVGSLRQTASIGGDGMFGSGPGSDTYADWFDQNLAERLSSSSHIGIREQLMTDFERNGELPKRLALDAAGRQAEQAAALQRRTDLITARKPGLGGTDVVL